MGCARENVCLKLHDYIEMKSYWDKNAIFPSFVNIVCSGCHAVATLSFRNEEFVISGRAACSCLQLTSSLGEILLAEVIPTGRGSLHPVLFVGRGVLERPLFPNLYNCNWPSQIQSSTKPGEWLQRGLTCSSAQPAFFPSPTGSDPADTSQYTPCT